MRLKLHLLFIFYTLLFLFYPGDSYYFHIFAYNRNLFQKKETFFKKNSFFVPYLKSNYYPEVSAESVYVVDLDSFTPVFKKNENLKLMPASTTKIITALVAYDLYKPSQIITVKKTINEGQIMGLVNGEKITVENLLYGMLIHSGNDAAYVLAEDYGYDQFVKLMNEKAGFLNMKKTHFVNPAGFDSAGQMTTSFDLALAARALLKNQYLAKIVSIKEITISDIDFKYFHKLTNINQLLGVIQGVGGLKTGYTEAAGENLVSFYKNNGNQFIIVLMKSNDRFQDTKNIIQWIKENVDYLRI